MSRPSMVVMLCLALQVAGMQASAQSARFVENYWDGLAAADQGNQSILLDFHAPWCGWCKVMDDEVYANEAILQKLQGVTLVKVDIDQEPEVALAYGVRSIPRTILVNRHRQVIADVTGYQAPVQFLQLLRSTRTKWTSKQPEATPMPEVVRSEAKQVAQRAKTELADSTQVPAGMEVYLSHTNQDVREQAYAVARQNFAQLEPQLWGWLSSEYLGLRIAAWELLSEREPEPLPFDPWASAAERKLAAGAFTGPSR